VLRAFEHIVAGLLALALDLPRPATESSRGTIDEGSGVQIAHTAGTADVAVIEKGAASRTTLKTTSVATAYCGLVELVKLSHWQPRKAKSDGFEVTEVESEIITLEQVAACRNAWQRLVYRLAQNGEIPAFKRGGSWRFRPWELGRWIAESIGKKKPAAE
jgi:excisionase family DNA binding protein